MLAALLATALAAAPAAPPAPPPFRPARPAAVADEDLSAAALAHPVSLARVEAYAKAVRALREAAERDPAVKRTFRSGDRFASLAESARRLEAAPPVKAILDRHGVTGRDFLLTPTVVLAGRATVLAEKGGQGAPAPIRDSAAVALWRQEGPRLEALVAGFMADLQALAAP